MSPVEPLPPRFLTGPFRTREALSEGVTPKRLRADDLSRPVRGTRSTQAHPTLAERCQALQQRLEVPAHVSDATAGQLWEFPLPARLTTDDRIHATVATGTRAPHAEELRGHQRWITSRDVTSRDGVLLTTPARTLCDLAAVLLRHEALAIADFIVARRRPLTSIDELRYAVDRHRGRRGRVILRLVHDLVDDGAESPKESELRLALFDAGFVGFVCNFTIRSESGVFLARADLALPGLRIALEYQGDHHRDPQQWRKDVARRRRLEAHGWVVIEATQADLDAPIALFTDIRRAIAARSAQ